MTTIIPSYSQSVVTWKLVRREYPVLPDAVVEINTGRNAGSFIKVVRTQRRGEAIYISKSVAHGQQECFWKSGFIWNDQMPESIITGKEIQIPLEARFDIRQGNGCGIGRIGVTYGSREDPLRDGAPGVVRVRAGLADPDPGGIAPPVSTEVFRVNARPDLPDWNLFTVAIHISDGGVTNVVVALYVYEKVTGETPVRDTGRNVSTGTIVRLQSFNYPDHYIRHKNYLGEITPITSDPDRKDATFRIVRGLADGNYISFESVNFPGYYLRQQNFRIILARGSGDMQFRKDATFKIVPGLANDSLASFESYSYPGYYIRHRNFHLYLERGNTDLFRSDATFRFSAFGR